MKEVNWNEAPEWADRAGYTEINKSLVWLNEKQYTYADGDQSGRIFKFSSGGVFQLEDFHNVQYRPTQWRGMQDGLPPIGTECEWKPGSGHWKRCTVEWRKEGYVLVRNHNSHKDYQLLIDARFRPIQSERDKGIDEAMSHIHQDWHAEPSVSTSEFVTNAVAQLYDAGYRKQMSRFEADRVLWDFLGLTVPQHQKDKILDALGYKE